MALNISFSGYVYHIDNSLGNEDIWYRVYFRKINVSSSTSKWDDYNTVEGNIRKCESTGYFSFNLGDQGLLSQSGFASSGDIVIVTFFINDNDSNDNNKDSCNLTAIGTYEWVLTTAENYSKNMQLVSVDETINSNCKPDISSWILNGQGPGGTSNGVVLTNYSYSATSCNYVTQNIYSTAYGDVMYHWWVRNGIVINNGFRILTYEYDFDNGTGWHVLTSSGNIQWSSAGIYKCLLRLTTCFGNSNTSIRDTNDIEMVIRWRQPVPSVNCFEDDAFNHINIPDTPVTFQYDGTDLDNKIVDINWLIHDTGYDTTRNNELKSAIVNHSNGPGTSWYSHTATSGAFGNSGSHEIEIWIKWDNGIDGTSTPVIHFSKTFIQDIFSGPILNFIQSPPQALLNDLVSFINTSTNISRVGTAGSGEEYDWKFNDSGTLTWSYDNQYSYNFNHIPNTYICSVTLYAHWNDGFFDHITDFTKNVIFSTRVEIRKGEIGDATCIYTFHIEGSSTGGGAPSGYDWRIYFEPSSYNTLIWTSPIDLDQQDKRYYFPQIGWYRVFGRVYGSGSPTSDYEDIYIDEICVDETCPNVTIYRGGAVKHIEIEKPKITVTKITVDGGKSIAKELIEVTELKILY